MDNLAAVPVLVLLYGLPAVVLYALVGAALRWLGFFSR